MVEISDIQENIEIELGMRGYWPSIFLKFYSLLNPELVIKEKHAIIDAYFYNQIAFLKIDLYSNFIPRELKIIDSKSTLPINQNVISIGVQNPLEDGLSFLRSDTKITAISNLYGCKALIVEPNKIYKGMSGGPVLDANSFKVIGVNYTGQSKDVNKLEPVASCASIINKESFKFKEKWNKTNDIAKIYDQKILNKYGY